ncbi:uncharacterized protein N7515_006945 [Penicillium bovifimosum]|uniref:Chromo domain-containing protein n=1 Tax=Penicillium bovifimosum TaxID=126998 RepID=A0A9W9GVX0_9EURO|nr:uncharacterized protein N7515_006945 [Penicillium bovifimosum]KAJ5130906.1 hypothetical protein N7515_006945 [Penicillium bovifimosum]
MFHPCVAEAEALEVQRQSQQSFDDGTLSKIESTHSRSIVEEADNQTSLEPTECEVEEIEEERWKVEEIKEEKSIQGTNYFLLKWIGRPSEYNEWVPEEDMENLRDEIEEFREAKPRTTKTRQPPTHSQLIEEEADNQTTLEPAECEVEEIEEEKSI